MHNALTAIIENADRNAEVSSTDSVETLWLMLDSIFEDDNEGRRLFIKDMGAFQIIDDASEMMVLAAHDARVFA